MSLEIIAARLAVACPPPSQPLQQSLGDRERRFLCADNETVRGGMPRVTRQVWFLPGPASHLLLGCGQGQAADWREVWVSRAAGEERELCVGCGPARGKNQASVLELTTPRPEKRLEGNTPTF